MKTKGGKPVPGMNGVPKKSVSHADMPEKKTGRKPKAGKQTNQPKC